jgi:hypothetical protein
MVGQVWKPQDDATGRTSSNTIMHALLPASPRTTSLTGAMSMRGVDDGRIASVAGPCCTIGGKYSGSIPIAVLIVSRSFSLPYLARGFICGILLFRQALVA